MKCWRGNNILSWSSVPVTIKAHSKYHYYLVFTGWIFLNLNASPFLFLFITPLIFFQLCFLCRPKEHIKCKIKYFIMNFLKWITYYFRTASPLYTFWKMIEKTKSKITSLGSRRITLNSIQRPVFKLFWEEI